MCICHFYHISWTTSHLLNQLNRRFHNIESNTILALGCLLDPRFKKVAFSDIVALEAVLRRLLSEMTGSTIGSTPEPDENESDNSTVDTSNLLWKAV